LLLEIIEPLGKESGRELLAAIEATHKVYATQTLALKCSFASRDYNQEIAMASGTMPPNERSFYPAPDVFS
jgi:hypothetical protein